MTKKQIGFIQLDNQIQIWLMDYLPSCLFRDEIEALMIGDYRSLVVSVEDEMSIDVFRRELYCGDLVLDERLRKVKRNGIELKLTPKEFDILFFLASNSGHVYSKQEIYHAVWQKEYVKDDSNIMAFIRKIRKKIEPDPNHPIYLLTIWGTGYKFNDKLGE